LDDFFFGARHKFFEKKERMTCQQQIDLTLPHQHNSVAECASCVERACRRLYRLWCLDPGEAFRVRIRPILQSELTECESALPAFIMASALSAMTSHGVAGVTTWRLNQADVDHGAWFWLQQVCPSSAVSMPMFCNLKPQLLHQLSRIISRQLEGVRVHTDVSTGQLVWSIDKAVGEVRDEDGEAQTRMQHIISASRATIPAPFGQLEPSEVVLFLLHCPGIKSLSIGRHTASWITTYARTWPFSCSYQPSHFFEDKVREILGPRVVCNDNVYTLPSSFSPESESALVVSALSLLLAAASSNKDEKDEKEEEDDDDVPQLVPL